MTIATMTSKGQITIPAATRSRLRLTPGSKVDFVENDAGEIVLKPVAGDIRRLRGIVKYDGPAVSVEDMNKAVGDAVAETFQRTAS